MCFSQLAVPPSIEENPLRARCLLDTMLEIQGNPQRIGSNAWLHMSESESPHYQLQRCYRFAARLMP